MNVISQTFLIARKELRSYFLSPVGWVVLTLFLFIAGFFFFNMTSYFMKAAQTVDVQISKQGVAGNEMNVPALILNAFFGTLGSITIFVFPLITMGLFADERKRGTLELLLTSPVHNLSILLGKFFAAVGFYAVLLACTMAYQVPLIGQGMDEWGIFTSGYFGLLLLGCVCAAWGLFVSTLTENQIIAAFGTYGILLTMWYIDNTSTALFSIWQDFVNFISLYNRTADFARGIISSRAVVYTLSAAGLGLFLTHQSIQAIRGRA